MQIRTIKQNYQKSYKSLDKAKGIDKKAEATKLAETWLQKLQKEPYKSAVEEAIRKTEHLNPELSELEEIIGCGYNRFEKTEHLVFNQDVSICAKAALTRSSAEDKVCVLCFASYSNPGGGFIKGSKAQEEDICHNSGLYPILKSKEEVYIQRREKGFVPTYDDDFIYVEDCPFIINGKIYKADVIVCAAPNVKSARCSDWESMEIMSKRMKKIFLYPAVRGCNKILLGAFGCGVFGNDPEFVSMEWQRYVENYEGLYKSIVHPVHDKDMVRIFKKNIREVK